MDGPGSVLGPLTTTFTPPISCSRIVVDCGNPCTTGAGYLGQRCTTSDFFQGPHENAPECWPPGKSGVPSTISDAQAFYSPGLICPAGYTHACSVTEGVSGGAAWASMYALTQGQTAVGCCPSNYACDAYDAHICTYLPSSGYSFLAVTCLEKKSTTSQMLTIPLAPPPDTGAMMMFAPMIEIRWESSDKTTSSTLTSTPSTASSPSPTIAPVLPTSKVESHHTGLGSSGLALEITVPVLVAVIGAAVLAFFLHRSHRRTSAARTKRQGSAPPLYPDGECSVQPVEMDEQRKAVEVEGPNNKHEMEEQRKAQELEAPNELQELERRIKAQEIDSPDPQEKVHEMASPDPQGFVKKTESPNRKNGVHDEQILDQQNAARIANLASDESAHAPGLRIVGQDDGMNLV